MENLDLQFQGKGPCNRAMPIKCKPCAIDEKRMAAGIWRGHASDVAFS
jgi:hypothetical protein